MGLQTYGIYGNIVGKMPMSKTDISDLIKSIYTYGGMQYEVENRVSEDVKNIDNFISPLTGIFLYVGIALAVFSMMLMMNFISASILYKKKEIGILRALGARGVDVFGIFFNESFIIALIDFALSTVATLCTVFGMNIFFRTRMYLNVTAFDFGLLQISLLFGVSLLSAFLASFLPIYFISKKRPIEAITK